MKKNNNQNSAFTLLEISISLMIIGVLIAGTIKAGSMIKESRQLARKWKLQGQGPEIPNVLVTKDNQLWFDGSNINGSFNVGIRDGEPIEIWKNAIKKEYDAYQPVASRRPIYHALDKSIKFDGADDYLPIKNKFYKGRNLDNLNVFVVAKSSSANRQIMISYDRSEYFRFSLRDDAIADQLAFDTYDKDGVSDFGGGVYTNGIAHIFHGQYERNKSPNNKIIYVDGKVIHQTTAHGRDPLGRIYSRYGFIGVGSEAPAFNSTTGPNYFMNGHIYEIILLEDILTEKEVHQINHYLARKWNLIGHVDSDNDGTIDINDKQPTNKNEV